MNDNKPLGDSLRELPDAHLRFAIGDCLREGSIERRTLSVIQDRLFREDPETVMIFYDAAVVGSIYSGPLVGASGNGRHGRLAERMKELKRAPLVRARKGMTLREIAAHAGIERETLAALLEHHGYLETVPYGRTQSRRLVSERTFHADFGHNVNPSTRRSPRLDGMGRSSPFPVFYREALASILWTLDWSGVQHSVGCVTNKRQRIRLAMTLHGYLPNEAIAGLCRCTTSSIEKARQRGRASCLLVTSTHTFVEGGRQAA